MRLFFLGLYLIVPLFSLGKENGNSQLKSLFTYDPNYGLGIKPNGMMRAKLDYKDHKVFDVVYNTDQFGRRITPSVNYDVENFKKFAIFLGCSFVWGVGVENNQTIPFEYSKIHPEYHVYNYGIPGPALIIFWPC